ncbi:MAG: T9SS type A sorting domain-containing protein [Bacteroidetes bacterium]|nr:T9SS type A sorting domain-containing protein [Bacteroidota bacterium]
MKRALFTFFAIFALVSVVISQNVPRKMVCLEIATSTTCTYCPGAAMGAEDLLANGKFVAVVENHCNIPSTGDPYVWAGSLARLSLFGVTSAPTASFDGVTAYIGGSHTTSVYAQYLPKYNARIGVDSPIDMSMTFTNSGLHYDATVTVIKVGTVTATSLKLIFFVTESNISKNWQGQHWLHFVNHMMIPDQNGTTIDFSSGNTQTFNLSFDLDAAYVLENCEFVATVQNMDASQGSSGGIKKREEIQTIKSGVIPLAVDFTSDKDTINPNETVQFTSSVSGGYVNVNQTYEWHFPGATPDISNDTNPIVIYTVPGNFDVQLIINRGGEIDTVTRSGFIYVNHGLAIKEQAGNQVVVSPNPSNGTFKLTFNVANSFVGELKIMNSAGSTVYSESNVTVTNNLTKTIRVHGLPAGEYFLTVQNGDTKLSRKILIN